VSAAPVAARGVVYAASHDHHLYAIEADTGRLLWQSEAARRIELSPALSPDGTRIFIVDKSNTLTALARPSFTRPDLELHIHSADLMQDKWSKVQFTIRNRGDGLAQRIIVHSDERGQFEGRVAESRELTTLEAGAEHDEWLEVRPIAYGDVPLKVGVDYEDEAGRAHSIEQTFFVPVAPPLPASASFTVAPGAQLVVGGDLTLGDKLTAGGDIIEAGTQANVIVTSQPPEIPDSENPPSPDPPSESDN